MKHPCRLLLFLSFLLSYHLSIYAQQDKDLQAFYADKLKANGVIVTSDVTAIPYVDIDRAAKYNFDAYRAYNIRQQVKLKRGPTIELLSISERLTAGIYIDSVIVGKKKSLASDANKYQIMAIVDIGIGTRAPERRGERATYYALPKE